MTELDKQNYKKLMNDELDLLKVQELQLTNLLHQYDKDEQLILHYMEHHNLFVALNPLRLIRLRQVRVKRRDVKNKMHQLVDYRNFIKQPIASAQKTKRIKSSKRKVEYASCYE